MSKKHKTFNKEEKDGETAKLKRHIRHLEKENTRLKSELRTYEKVFARNITFLKQRTEDLTVEELITGAEKEFTLRQIREEKAQTYEQLQEKWRCHSCSVGVMKLIIIPRGSGTSNYFRKCNNTDCKNRTQVKEYNETVEGLK